MNIKAFLLIFLVCGVIGGFFLVAFLAPKRQEEERRDLIISTEDTPLVLSRPPSSEIARGLLIIFDSGRGNVYYGVHFYKDHNWALVIRNIGSRENQILYVWKEES